MELRPLEHTREFTVGRAEYLLTSNSGENAALSVNYAGNTFVVESDSKNKNFLHEAAGIARGLLARKHAVNLAMKEHYIISE